MMEITTGPMYLTGVLRNTLPVKKKANVNSHIEQHMLSLTISLIVEQHAGRSQK